MTFDELDRDGAICEAFDAAIGESRAAFLGRALVGGGALLAALSAPPSAEAAAASDIAILNYALTLEYVQAAFYTETERMGAIGAELAPVPAQLGAVERGHVKALRKVLGKAAVKRPSFNFAGVTEDRDAFLKTAVAFEDLAVAAYKGQAARVKSSEVLAAAVSIHTVEARHAAWMRYLVGIQPAAVAFDEPRPEEQVRAIVASTKFIVAAPQMQGKGNPRFTG
jgi:rubrerythrin